MGTPIGILAGTHLAEFGGKGRIAEIIRFVNDILLSAPSIVMGLFVYQIIVRPTAHFSALSGSVALAFILLPVVVRTTDETIRLVPVSLREAALALGAPQWRVIVQILYPAARTGMITGVLLGIARISGETAPLLFTALNNQYLDRRSDAADGEYSRGDLPVCAQPLPGLAPTGLGRGASHDPVRAGRERGRPVCPALAGRKDMRMPQQGGTAVRPQIGAIEVGRNNARPNGNAASPVKVEIQDLDFFYGSNQALKHVTLRLPERQVTGMIGPSGCGKSTLLRVLNRMYDLYPGQRATGRVMMDGENLIGPDVDLIWLRSRVGMLFQKPTPFPMSIYDNIAFGVRLHERLSRAEMDERVEWSLTRAALWGEVKDRLRSSATGLSGGQQQRLCIARSIAVRPEVILLDEPTSALDPISTLKIEELIDELKQDFTIVIVTHNMQQAARCADQVAFFYLGELVEAGRRR